MQYPGAPPPQQQFVPTSSVALSSPPSNNSNNNNVNVDAKILSDLSVVQEKIALCQSILTNEHICTSSQIDSHDSLLTIIGFLEACVPRVRELIDVGMAVLKEETLTMCFQVNDELCKILEDVEHPEKRSVGAATAAAAEPTTASSAYGAANGGANAALDSLDFDAFGFEDRKKSVSDGAGTDVDAAAHAQPATTKIAASTLEDLLAPPSETPPAASPSASAANKKENQKESKSSSDGDDGEFDDFFGARQVSNNSFSIDE
mmetsp:Transcript_16348/g.20686  ORF Transcript_16348/g.20686 Transcript_16348/m.20686 type:complete len:261 (-) Transcript_16348:440-1222(-)|eukprot:CAMPEP_0203634616 /NCGR_PEP_ID=MMETSP0088-20131115/1513_1 /ASSEMBLY_ACC=CAM_ASM_001087 /TAXON_ID=426623 /ORGANISM="Chaetoceros affinis, Strain CCMP159" /LENGTH=260 /DNA_ID=CAMNT_0050488255 /DNA_START=228 /DNA_END=1010 /DNA_ORIENTATION=-